MAENSIPKNPNSEWALYYSSYGLSVVPVSRCAKVPAIPWAPYQQERASEEVITNWFDHLCRDAGVGIVTGAVSGIFVVDVDVGPGKPGEDNLQKLQIANDDLPETWTVKSGGGGRHFYFRMPPGVRIKTGANILSDGIDVRGDGGYVVAPPSVHPNGNAYKWDQHLKPGEIEIAEAPDWLINLVGSDSQISALTTNSSQQLDASGRRIDGREEYMRDLVWARMIAEHRSCPIPPTGEAIESIVDELWETYQRQCAARGQSLEADGRGWAQIKEKVEYTLQQWGGKLKEAAALPLSSNGAPNISEDKPKLLVEAPDPDQTVSGLRDILSQKIDLYDRGVPVRLANDQMQQGVVAQVVTPDGLVLIAHQKCRPYVLKEKDGELIPKNARLPLTYTRMYLDWRGEWNLPPFNGIASSPLLKEGGLISDAAGYDAATGMWCENVPDTSDLVPDKPTIEDAEFALLVIRECFKTFCFADAETIFDPVEGTHVVETTSPPGQDESAFLVALLTAVCRPSLHLSPGVLVRAAQMSGAGAGKGLLARCISQIAFGRDPHAVTGGYTGEELEKQIASELIAGGPVLFLDNLNNRCFKSNLLASAITERPARVRVLGRSQMVPLNATAFVILTGNGLTVSEDLARRFITIEFDPKTEDPESRSFVTDIRSVVIECRIQLLAAVLTIWRWGQLADDLARGRPLGSFEQWGRWIRDPLLTLGCQDPVARISESKLQDTSRQNTAELFQTWWDKHGDKPVAQKDLDAAVRVLADPNERGRQYLSAYINRLVGTRIAGFVLTREKPGGKWSAASYVLKRTDEAETIGVIGVIGVIGPNQPPMPPMTPMPYDDDEGIGEVVAQKRWSQRI